MSSKPIPVVFEPLFKPKPWGGRMLETLFGKPLPPGESIGESWEIVSLPGNESHVRGGPLAGCQISGLAGMWGPALYGAEGAERAGFPLLIKFLDARENLSVQVHPKPTDRTRVEPGVKHEAWFVVHADPGAEMFVGLKPGVTLNDLAESANTPRTAELLRRWPVTAGHCYYLPSGVIHALGAGIVVAEIQTPSEVTYRLYDWDRLGSDGKPRELHIEQALRNVRTDVPDEEILQAAASAPGAGASSVRLARCERFHIDRVRLRENVDAELPGGRMAIWIVLAGAGRLIDGDSQTAFSPGDTVLIPAERHALRAAVEQDCDLLEVTLPPAA